MDIADFLSHGFIQRALIAGCFISVLCSTLGVFLVLRRLSLIGDGLAHVTFGSIAVGLLFRTYPFYVAVPIVMASSVGILKLIERARLFGDTAIGIVSSVGVATGVLLASAAGGFNIDLFSYLFGNILSITSGEVMASVLLCLAVFVVIGLFYHELMAVTFDEESARASGIRVGRINTVLVLLTALTVVLAMKVVGIMLISALLILPPSTALQMARGFRATIATAAMVSVVSVMIGTVLSFLFDLPTGAAIVILNFLFFIAVFAVRHFRRQRG